MTVFLLLLVAATSCGVDDHDWNQMRGLLDLWALPCMGCCWRLVEKNEEASVFLGKPIVTGNDEVERAAGNDLNGEEK